MERGPTRIRTTLAVSVLALTLIAPWSLGQDPDWITEIRRQAEQGNAIAQHNLGLMYANGTGVPQDDVLAYAWLNLATAQGNELASENQDKLRTRMTANQIARAQELSATLFDRIN